MKFLTKPKEALDALRDLRYGTDDNGIRRGLIRLQQSYCAYTERYLGDPLESVDIEHFDPRLKGTPADSIDNWHAVVHKQNITKSRKIENHEPLADPNDSSVPTRWTYRRGFFEGQADDDVEMINLIRWVGCNNERVVTSRRDHLNRTRRLMNLLGQAKALALFSQQPSQLQFATALQHELGLPMDDLLAKLPQGPAPA